jgi:hypothetical protein
MKPGEKSCPVVNWATACNPDLDAVFLRLDYLANERQTPEGPHEQQIFALSRA